MSAVVTSCGRTGTNMVLEILTGSSFFRPTEPAEDKKVFTRGIIYNERYLTKCDTVYYEYENIKNTLIANNEMKIIWTIRDPRDMILSKFRRGVPKERGGDCKRIADDATLDGALLDINKMMGIYKNLISEFNDRVMLVKMEDAILDTEGIAKNMCEFLSVIFQSDMVEFWKRMRVDHKRARYSGKDISQVGLYKHWRDVYDGWFVKNDIDIESAFSYLDHLVRYFKYEG